MRKYLFFALALMLSIGVMGQQPIQLRSADKAECVSSDFQQLKASFSFSTIEAENVETQRGQFSWLSMPNTVIGGNEGDPQIPVVNELIAVPFGAHPRIEITSYSTTDYRLEDLGIQTLIPRQPSLRKDQRPEEVPFVYNEAAYQTRGLRSEPQAVVSVEGTMRGIQVGKMTIEPVSYDPVSNTLRVFNDIEVTVRFDGADARATEDMLVSTYSPYFDVVYAQMFNSRMVRDAYSEHPDLYTTPVKMIVITTATYANNQTFQNWVNWKKQKGIYTTVYTTATTGTTAANIKSFIRNKYSTEAPTFVVIVGDTGDVTYSLSSSTTSKVTDLYYSTTDDSDLWPEMFLSRMPVSSTTELTNLLNKIMTYEQYTMANPSYLGNTLLIAGWDGTWTNRVGKPTIQYANTYYFNSSNNINPYVFLTTGSGQTTCYNYINDVGFANYTAHGGETGWSDPGFSVSNVNSMTNNDKYLWAMGNCCLAANWGYSGTCFAEALLRAANKGAFGYIGSCPETYWWEDYYFGVGATSTYNQMPTMEQTQTGVYDAMFMDDMYNTLNSVPFLGNIAVAYAHANNYTSSVTDKYYWEAYHTLGDGSVMPYHTVPAANNVSFSSSIVAGTNSFRVNADAGSYVAITVNNEIIGVAAVPANATYVDVPFTTTPVAGQTAMIVVTRNQRQPYINNNVPVINNNAPQYTITANANPTAGGTVEGAGTYYENTNCTLTAVANHGYAFNNWNDNNTENPRTFTVTGNATYTANFRVLEEHQVSYTPSQSHGSISASPTTAYAGDIVTLTATPDAGYMLDYWTVTTVGRENIPVENNQFTMPDCDVTVSATFKTEPITVFDGTATNQFIPMYGYYFDDYTKSECIIPASQLTAMNGCTVTAITFYPSSVATTNSTWANTSQTVFLKEVSGTTLGGSYSGTSGATTVKQGLLEMPTAGEAYTITFDTPYTYNGGNLLIGVYNTDDGSYNKVEWYGTSNLTSGVSAYGSNGNSLSSVGYTAQSFLPKTTFTYIPTTTPYIGLAPSSATVLTGFTETLTATYGNVNGTPSITFSSSNTNVATVSGNGNTATVTAVAPGTATITASMIYEGTPYTATCTITVEDPSYCTPNPTSVDGKGITTLTFGSGEYVVNNSNSNGLPSSAPYYADYTSMVGGYEAGETATVTITYTTGSTNSNSTIYSYGTLIWVDWNKNYTFEDSEIVYTGTSTQVTNGTPQVLTATFNVPDSQAADDYRMRIAGADSYFDSYIGGSASANHDPCFTSTYAVCHDYTLRVISTYICPTPTITSITPGSATATISTDSDASSFNVMYREYVESAPTTYTYDFEDGWQDWTTFQGNTTSPNSWMHNSAYPTSNNNFSTGYGYNGSDGFMLSESYISGTSGGSGTAVTPDNYLVSPQVRLGGSISFYAGARNTSYCAEKFSVMVSTTDNTNAASFTTVGTWTLSLSQAGYNPTPYTVDLSAYSGMGYIAIRHYDCYDQWFLCVDNITITTPAQENGEWIELSGVNNLTITGLTPETTYEVQVQAICGDEDDTSNWSESTMFTTTENTGITQTISLSEGWNWWAPNVDITLEDFEASLGSNAISITAQDGSVATYNANFGWGGNLNSIEVGKMYMVRMSQTCTVSVNGTLVDPAEHPVTLIHGANWIGFIGTEEMTLNEALTNFTPTNLDNIKTQTGTAIYYQGIGWRGNFSTLVPGQGYIYNSKASTPQTFTFPSAK